MTDPPNDLLITPEQARQALDQERSNRVEACAAALAKLLKRHNCRLDALPLIVDGHVVAQVQLVAAEPHTAGPGPAPGPAS
ncbi:hypothetical protein ACFLWA_12630 [Chloroflexota bacterium]